MLLLRLTGSSRGRVPSANSKALKRNVDEGPSVVVRGCYERVDPVMLASVLEPLGNKGWSSCPVDKGLRPILSKFLSGNIKWSMSSRLLYSMLRTVIDT
jgi:hypothetical protein